MAGVASATNPEQVGPTTFTYDNNGNLLTKKDARNITTTTGYDTLNRALGTTFTDSTPPVTFCYDGKIFDTNTGLCADPATAVPNPVGRLTGVGSTVSATNFLSFDAAGRILASEQETDGFDYNFAYTYNKAGGLETQQYPSGFQVNTCYDDAGRIDGLTKDGASFSYVSSPAYAPHGAVEQLTLGNGLLETTQFNNRLQPTQIQLGSLLTLGFTYKSSPGADDNNGNVLTQTINPPGIATLTQTYSYDPLNRLQTAAESGGGTAWSRTYSYDQYGNRAVTGNTGLGNSPLMAGSLTDYVAATNQYVTGPGAFDNDYDEAGNQERNKLGELLAYDANSRQTSHTTGSATTTYHYDPNGNRVKKVTPTKTDIYVYDAFGKMAAEYSTVATTAPVGAHYRTVDHLGSARLVTLQDQSAFACYDYAPFGEEIPDALGNRSLVTCYAGNLDDRQKFTGKERDSESGMDYFLARYYAGPMGRFLSVDPDNAGALPDDPQSWNAYSYTRSNPLKYVDPTGEFFVVARRGRKQVQQFISTMLRTSQGRATINAIATSPLPVSFSRGKLSSVKNPGGTSSIDAGQSKLVSGNTPGAIGGVDVTLDKSNIKTIAKGTGQSKFATGLKAFAHETQHVTDMLSATTFQGAVAAGVAGDAPSSPGANNTTGGTAESRAQQIVGASGAAGQSFQPNAQFDAAAAGIIKRGAAQQEAAEQAKQTATCLAATPGGPCP